MDFWELAYVAGAFPRPPVPWDILGALAAYCNAISWPAPAWFDAVAMTCTVVHSCY